jgi:hypothetical protein
MTPNGRYDEQRLGELLRALPPVPEGWVEAAQELPRVRRDMDDIVTRAVADGEFRRALIEDLETALRAEGYEPEVIPLDELRKRLDED